MTTAGETVRQQVARGVITQRQIAEKISRNHATIQRYIRRENLVPLRLAERIGNAIFPKDAKRVRAFVELCRKERQERKGDRVRTVLVRRSLRAVQKKGWKVNVQLDAKTKRLPSKFKNPRGVPMFLGQDYAVQVTGSMALLYPERAEAKYDLVSKYQKKALLILSSDGLLQVAGFRPVHLSTSKLDTKKILTLRAFRDRCEEEGLPFAGVIELLRAEVDSSSVLNAATYLSDDLAIMPAKAMMFAGQTMSEALDYLRLPNATEQERKLALAMLEGIAATLESHGQQAAQAGAIRDRLSRYIQVLSEGMR